MYDNVLRGKHCGTLHGVGVKDEYGMTIAKEEAKNSGRKLLQGFFSHHKSSSESLGIKPRYLW
jgi:hypothetical protein